MPNLLNFLPNAVGQSGPRIVYAQVTTPVPTSFASPLYLNMPQWSTEFFFQISNWPAIHGSKLPVLGAAALLEQDSNQNWRCTWWDGAYAAAGVAIVATTAATGTALVNGTPTILSWVAPNDGEPHQITLTIAKVTTVNETGGTISCSFVVGGAVQSVTAIGGGAPIGVERFAQTAMADPNTTVSITQGALTGGASKIIAIITAT